MANITLMGASYTDVPAVTLPQTGGGTVTFYENSGGGGIIFIPSTIDASVSGNTLTIKDSVKTATGTFTGNGTRQVTISCNFEPDLVYWYSDPGTSASSGTVAGMIARGMLAANQYRNNTTTNSNNIRFGITDMNTDGSSYSFRATYENSTVTLYCFSSNARSLFTSNRTYSYKFVKWTT